MIGSRQGEQPLTAAATLRARLDRIVMEGLLPAGPDEPRDQARVPPRDSAERHTVRFRAACLYLDVRGSSDLLAMLGPRPTAQLIRTFLLGATAVTRAHGGEVRGVHGDALLAFFAGSDRSLRAIKTALDIDRFAQDVLRPRLDRLPAYREAALWERSGFEVGFGVDEGSVCALPVDAEGAADRIWAGSCTNTAAKLSKHSRGRSPLTVTREALGDVVDDALPGIHWSEEQRVWVAAAWRTVRVGGAR